MEMVRLYDTRNGVFAADEQNRSLRKPGHILISYRFPDNVIKPCYTRELIEIDNLLEEIREGAKANTNRLRIMDEGALVKRVTTITKYAYVKTAVDYEHPGCIGQITRALRIRKSFDDMLRAHFKK